MYTVLGLREIGHRAALVGHPDGELLRRMSEGLDLIPLAPRNEIDLAAAWRLSRVIKQLKPDVIHAHDPHGVAMAAMALSIAIAVAATAGWSPPGESSSASARTRSRAGSTRRSTASLPTAGRSAIG